ncbi:MULTISPECIES: NAD(P) transhydrogenase subunit alpha [Lactobacillaceae]|uniref:proton-translocating NAD(P)(+) transhydrogenase n=2 Tax=Lentilactobacillus buchneri TaxID=1581 RepID=J9WA15_LENBU|nr:MULTISPECIES: NAD(P) transhydrogenase subunit alpha [Lactobacillaceae]MCC6101034.1 NAD(P) transhydrogenase subunit alpha [Lactobacillus sp.]WCJ52359.1 NAD(P) transhydrogenase subunit alpha [Lentilactobacillus sp. Egmn17]AFS00921.1 NAD(P) transhydrogenase subunit alpha [Lentilactobacillus buchneri subsp. silagei CD034]MCE6021103.1 NAD(P) transhydrogenase subunit alpha [Levilactobacillus brevis]MCT2881437.1 NAD(P) transhydrogenase subunit alpha [Lentilactobacillus buchneri]
MSTIIAALKESGDENRVAITPDVAAKLVHSKFEVMIEQGAGQNAYFSDQAYQDAGAKVVSRDDAVSQANVIATVDLPDSETLGKLHEGQILIGLLKALTDLDSVQKLAKQKVTALSFELLPRTISRAQSMDVLSSQASIAGYKAALVAADKFARYFPMMITAAGTAKPAKVLVLGTGVAGLQAIGTAKRLGAIVSGYDVRPASRGEVESLGAEFLTSSVSAVGEGGYARQLSADEQKQQQDELIGFIKQNDIVITTAQVPGRKPPLLVPQAAVDNAKPGSVFVDLAASDLGGNVAGSKPDQTVITDSGVQLIGAGNLASEMATSASEMFSKNVQAVINDVADKDAQITIDLKDDVMSQLVATDHGEIISERVRKALNLPISKPAEDDAAPADSDDKSAEKGD